MFAGAWNFLGNKSHVAPLFRDTKLGHYIVIPCGSGVIQCLRKLGDYVISGLHCGINKIFALLGCYVAKSGCNLSTFRDNIAVPPSRIDPSSWYQTNYRPNLNGWPSKLEPIGCPGVSVNNYKTMLHNVQEEPWSLGKLLITDARSYVRIKVLNSSLWDCHVSYNFTSLHFTSLHFTSLRFASLHFASLRFTSRQNTIFYFICVWLCIMDINNVDDQLDATIKIYWYSNWLNMLRAIFCPSSRALDCILQLVVYCTQVVAGRCPGRRRHCLRLPGHRPATTWVHYTSSCQTQSSAPKDGQIIARNMLSQFEYQWTITVASSWSSRLFTIIYVYF